MTESLPKRPSLKETADALRRLPALPVEKREPIEMPDRDELWAAKSAVSAKPATDL